VVILLRFPERPGATAIAAGGFGVEPGERPGPESEPPANLRFLLTPDHDPSLDYLDQLSGLDSLDDSEREARIANARHTAS